MKFLLVQEWGEEEGVVREWGFLVGCKSGERKEGAGREGAFVGYHTGIFIVRETR
jgi:hypothetical protein